MKKLPRLAARPTSAPAWRSVEETLDTAAAPGPYDASQFMKFCIKFDKFYATQEEYDVSLRAVEGAVEVRRGVQ